MVAQMTSSDARQATYVLLASLLCIWCLECAAPDHISTTIAPVGDEIKSITCLRDPAREICFQSECWTQKFSDHFPKPSYINREAEKLNLYIVIC
jgi:hypothetical protein